MWVVPSGQRHSPPQVLVVVDSTGVEQGGGGEGGGEGGEGGEGGGEGGGAGHVDTEPDTAVRLMPKVHIEALGSTFTLGPVGAVLL